MNTGAHWGREELTGCPAPLTQLSVNRLWKQGSAVLAFVSSFPPTPLLFLLGGGLVKEGFVEQKGSQLLISAELGRILAARFVWQVTLNAAVRAAQLWPGEAGGVRAKGQTRDRCKALNPQARSLDLDSSGTCFGFYNQGERMWEK